MTSLITQYLGAGVAASRPGTPSVPAGALAWYFATDTETLSLYDPNDAGWQIVGQGDLIAANNLSDLANPATGRTNLGATTVGSAIFTVANPSAIRFLRVNADNSVSLLDASSFRTAIGAGTGTGSGDLVAANNLSDVASAATSATNLGLGTGSSPQFTGINLGHASDTTLTRTGAGDIAVEGNAIYRAGGTDVPVADGGTGAGTAAGAATNLGLGTGDSPQFTAINVGHASDTTLARSSAGNLTVEGNLIYRAGGSFVGTPFEMEIACSDETTAITTGTAKVTFRMPCAVTLTAVRASVNTAPTGSTILIDINEAGTTILSTKLMIDASEKTSVTAATPAVISDAALADDAEMTIDFDQVGSTIAGKGVKVVLIGTRA